MNPLSTVLVIDCDSDKDLVIGNEGISVILLNDGTGTFMQDTSGRLPATTRVTQDVEAADIDGDGDLDLIFGNEGGNQI